MSTDMLLFWRFADTGCSDWPTIPQLYVSGEFVGGCDILLSSKSAYSILVTSEADISVQCTSLANSRSCSRKRVSYPQCPRLSRPSHNAVERLPAIIMISLLGQWNVLYPYNVYAHESLLSYPPERIL